MSVWIDIEHVPKDGTLVDLWVVGGDANGRRLPDCWWRPPTRSPMDTPAVWCFRSDGGYWIPVESGKRRATHYSLPLSGPNT